MLIKKKFIFRLKTSGEHMLTLLEFLTALPEEVFVKSFNWEILIEIFRSIHQQ
jgi:hypothetical protein